jgi:hypothetical protein
MAMEILKIKTKMHNKISARKIKVNRQLKDKQKREEERNLLKKQNKS